MVDTRLDTIQSEITVLFCPQDKDKMVTSCFDVRAKLGGGGGREGGGIGDFEVSQHVSKQIATAQKLYTRWGEYTFCECSLSPLSKNVKIGSIGIPSKILASPL